MVIAFILHISVPHDLHPVLTFSVNAGSIVPFKSKGVQVVDGLSCRRPEFMSHHRQLSLAFLLIVTVYLTLTILLLPYIES